MLQARCCRNAGAAGAASTAGNAVIADSAGGVVSQGTEVVSQGTKVVSQGTEVVSQGT